MADPELSRDRIYQEIRADIRATDEISFKLLGLVPLVSGAAFLTFFFEDKLRAQPQLVVTLSLFAAFVTLAFFRWELRNIQTCSWLLRRSEEMEKTVFGVKADRPTAPHRIGKTQAAKAVYSVTILAWLLVPSIVSSLKDVPYLLVACYAAGALCAAGATLQAGLASIGSQDGSKTDIAQRDTRPNGGGSTGLG